MNKYDELIRKVDVLPEDHERILQQIRRKRTADKKIRMLRTRKQIVGIAACFLLVLVGILVVPNLGKMQNKAPAGTVPQSVVSSAGPDVTSHPSVVSPSGSSGEESDTDRSAETTAQDSTSSETTAQVVSPVEQADSLSRLSSLVGFSVKTPSALPFSPKSTDYYSYDRALSEVVYSGSRDTLTVRMCRKTYNTAPSGDSSTYSSITRQKNNGHTVTLKGNGKTCFLAVWNDGTYAYSIASENGLTNAQMMKTVRSMRA